MSDSVSPYRRWSDYLHNRLTGRQRHQMEREMLRDPFGEDAYAGLNDMQPADFESDMALLSSQLANRTGKLKKMRPLVWFRVAAAIAIVAGGTALTFMLLHRNTQPAENEPIAANTTSQKPTPNNPVDESTPVVMPGKASREKGADSVDPSTQLILTVEADEPLEEEMDESVTPVTTDKDEALQALATGQEASMRRLAEGKVLTHEMPVGKEVSGQVLDETGEPLPGVAVALKGSENVTLTDTGGRFRLAIEDTSAWLTFQFIGYQTGAISANQAANEPIVMRMDLMALNEVVVVGYGAQKEAAATGAVSEMSQEDISGKPESATRYNRPVPPGGSVRALSRSVEEKLAAGWRSRLPEKTHVQVKLTVKADGTPADIEVSPRAGTDLAVELTRLVQQAGKWEPATRAGIPVESHIVIRLLLNDR